MVHPVHLIRYSSQNLVRIAKGSSYFHFHASRKIQRVPSLVVGSNIPKGRMLHGGSNNFYDPSPPPILFDMVLSNDWTSALKRVKSHPHEASYRHPRGWTPLHCAVEVGAPLEFVQAVVEAFPKGLKLKDWKGRSAEEVALYNETRDYLKQVNKPSENVSNIDYLPSEKSVIMETATSDGVKLHAIAPQIEKISTELLSMEKTCRSLRKELDGLIEVVKQK